MAVIGCGRAGASIAFHLVASRLCDTVILNDLNHARAVGEQYDLVDAASFSDSPVQVRIGSYAECARADIIVIAAGAAARPEQTEEESFHQTQATCRLIVDSILDYGFQGNFILLCSHVDTILQDIHMRSGLSYRKFLGLGNALNTNRLRQYISEQLHIDFKIIEDLYLMGNYSNPCGTFSAATAGGAPLQKILEQGGLWKTQEELINYGADRGKTITTLKNPTYYGVSGVVAAMIRSVLQDEKRIFCASVFLNGEYGINGIYASVPVKIDKNGRSGIAVLPLNQEEQQRFVYSVNAIQRINEYFL